MAFMKFSKSKPIYSVPNGIGDGSAYFNKTEGVIANVDNLPYGNSARTISCWIYPTQTNPFNSTMDFFSYGYPSTNNRYGLGIAKDFTSFEVFGYSNTTTYNYSVELKKWYHVVFTLDTDYTEKCYVNGVLIGTQTHNNINTLQGSATIGRTTGDNNTSWFYGNMKNVQVYNRVLSADEVTDLYNNQAVTNGLVLNVPLQYGKDNDSIFTSKNFVYDYSVIETSSGFDEFGYPIRYDIASECGIAYSLLPTKGLIFYAPCEIDANVKIGNQFTTSGEFTTQVVDDIKCLKFNVPFTQEVDTNVFVRNQVTLSALYYKKQTNTSGIILGYGTDSIYCYLALEEYYGQFYINHAMARLGTGYNMEDDTWYHLAVTLDNTTIKAYINGELVSTFTRDMNLHGGYLGLGGWAYGNGSDSPNGYITKCRIYNRPLTDKEIQQLAKEF